LAIADNKLAELGDWDMDMLSQELSFLFDPVTELDFDPRLIGFETVELDQILGDEHDDDRADPDDEFLPLNSQEPAVTKPGDVWICDQHRLLCGDACAYRKSNPDILMVQSAQDRMAENASSCLDGT